MDIIQDKIYLENKFAEDFGTPYFPVLADLYLQEKDLSRAKKVCEIGLKHDAFNTDGKYILSKVNLLENKLAPAEQLLKQVVEENPIHINALRILIEVQISLKRSRNSTQKYVDKLSKLLPNDSQVQNWEKQVSVTKPETQKPQSKEKPKDGKPKQKPTNHVVKKQQKKTVQISKQEEFKITPNMATFTLVNVLKAQQHFNQALSVLTMIENKGGDKSKITPLRDELNKLLNEK